MPIDVFCLSLPEGFWIFDRKIVHFVLRMGHDGRQDKRLQRDVQGSDARQSRSGYQYQCLSGSRHCDREDNMSTAPAGLREG